jgi:phage FluMu protein Com
MRCRACNKQLNDNESVYKNKETGEYLDMCNGCRRASFLTTDLLDVDEDKTYVENYFKNNKHSS